MKRLRTPNLPVMKSHCGLLQQSACGLAQLTPVRNDELFCADSFLRLKNTRHNILLFKISAIFFLQRLIALGIPHCQFNEVYIE